MPQYEASPPRGPKGKSIFLLFDVVVDVVVVVVVRNPYSLLEDVQSRAEQSRGAMMTDYI
jgi:hypothetical protein